MLLYDYLLCVGDIDEVTLKITNIVHKALEMHCPRAEPSLYTKR